VTLEADTVGQAWWWFDASFGIHHDIKSHTGRILSLGKGAVYVTSKRQIINNWNSNVAELVGINDLF